MIKQLLSPMARAKSFVSRVETAVSTSVGYGKMHQAMFKDFSERSLLLQGRALAQASKNLKNIQNLGEVEFRVFSQWGEDGIIEWLLQQVMVPNNRFVEFGVENFGEANCRFLLQNRNWRGLVFDGSQANISALRSERLFWMHDLTARAAFVSAENINALIQECGFSGPLGILSIDIDGNDYWVWKAIDCVNPAIVICEYNPILGDVEPIAVPYRADFQRFQAHHSGLYFGASIAALQRLAEQKGYAFVGTNSNGINAFFVRKDLAGAVVSSLSEIKAFPSRHRDSRNASGELSFAGGVERLSLIAEMPVLNVETGKPVLLKDLPVPYSNDWLAGMQ
jgi:hypothetical protein